MEIAGRVVTPRICPWMALQTCALEQRNNLATAAMLRIPKSSVMPLHASAPHFSARLAAMVEDKPVMSVARMHVPYKRDHFQRL